MRKKLSNTAKQAFTWHVTRENYSLKGL